MSSWWRSVSAKNELFAEARRYGLPLVDEITLIPDRPAGLVANLKRGSRLITLTGDVPTQQIKDSWGMAAATNGFEVRNNLRVQDNVTGVPWSGQAFDLLKVMVDNFS